MPNVNDCILNRQVRSIGILTEQVFGLAANRNVIQIMFMAVPAHRLPVMEPLTTERGPTYSFEEIIIASSIVIGMAVGAVLFVSAPVPVTTLAIGTMAGFVASRRLHARPPRIPARNRTIPEPSR